MCLRNEGKEFHIVELQGEYERCPSVFVHSLWIHRNILLEEERKFLLGVCTRSKSNK